MTIIFFDLETTDSQPIGQILNYCFIKTNSSFQPLEELSGRIRISRLQLPRPEAILVNRTDVLRHQQEAEASEAEAMQQIAAFIQSAVRESQGPVVLAGYNSSQFDLVYLRTSLIRNGLNPYFEGKLVYRDLLLAARKLSCSCPSFPRAARAGGDADRLSLTLENVAQQLGLLRETQSHFSRDDVLLSIDLARAFKERFKLDIAAFEAYELKELDHQKLRGKVFRSYQPNYDLKSREPAVVHPMTLLDANHRCALWIDLDLYREKAGRQSLVWCNKGNSSFFCEPPAVKDPELEALAAEAVKEFGAVNVANFFEVSSCDIEQDIYRLDFDALAALGEAIRGQGDQGIRRHPNRDVRVVYTRWKMANHCWGSPDDARVEDLLRKYALYRYGGKAQLAKTLGRPNCKEEFHPSFAALMLEIEQLFAKAEGQADRQLLDNLRSFYLSSDIYRVAGKELSSAAVAQEVAAVES